MMGAIPEGTWFAVPLRNGGYAVGVVSRTTARGGIVLAYFLPRAWENPPSLKEVGSFRPDSATRVLRIGDLGLVQGLWPTIGWDPTWRRADWPAPAFIRKDDLSGRAWRVEYSDDDANIVVSEAPIEFGTPLERDAVLGAGAAEIVLTKALSAG